MRPTIFSTEPILHLLRRTKIATLDQLSEALGSASPITVFRKLDQLHYRTSYSHRGRYYTLDRIARFDDNGLWSHDAVWFSRFGTLVDTAAAFVNRARSGYFVAELDQALHVSVQDTLLQLVNQGRLAPRDLEKIIRRCLRKDPAQCFQQVRDLKVALEELKEESGSDGRLQSVRLSPKQKWFASPMAWIAGLLLLVLATGGTIWFRLAHPSVQAPPLPVRTVPFTSLRGGVIFPAFSPDGKALASSV